MDLPPAEASGSPSAAQPQPPVGSPSSLLRQWLELLASMRFAISLLTIVAIASIIGTVLKQGEPPSNYLNQFGPFWFPAFDALGLYSVYSASWFLAILAFLVASISVCVWRNSPGMLREIRRWRSDLRERAMDNFGMRADFPAPELAAAAVSTPQQRCAEASNYLAQHGFSSRVTPVEASPGTFMLAARAGMLRRVGYVLAHSAMVLIFLGGLADSEVMLKLRLATGQSVPVKGSVTLDQVPPEARIAASNWSYRGNMLVPEGRSSGVAIVNAGDGILIQDLPFSISLKRFQIEHYSTGQPRLFASDVLVTDKDSGQSFEARIEVNKPLIHRGIAVYQSSFDDGGTLLKLSPLNLMGGMRRLNALEGRVGEVMKLDVGDDSWKLELVGFRPFNIENVGEADSADAASIATDTGSMGRLRQGFGSAAPSAAKKDLRNVGPSFQYKLRDAAGQALEYNNYMLPLQLDGRWFLASGVRESPSEPFRFLRLPLDENATLEQYLALRGVMLDSAAQREVARRFALGSEGVSGNSTLQSRLEDSALRVMETFSVRGYQAVAAFLENAVPEPERERAAEVYVRILQGVSWEAWMLARERAGLPRLESTPLRGRFVQDALNALSDSFFYGVPLYLQLSSYDEVKASVFQLTRSPGKPVVYGGCLLLVLGIFAMFFIRERRLWLLVRADGSGKLAFASNRRTLDIETEFAAHRAALGALLMSAAASQPGQ